jgi:hypothetical protein
MENPATIVVVNEWIPVITILITSLSSIALAYIAYKTAKLSQAIKPLEGLTSTIRALEVNTNSIKDALVKETSESSMAKGVLQGRLEAQLEQTQLEKKEQEDKVVKKLLVILLLLLPWLALGCAQQVTYREMPEQQVVANLRADEELNKRIVELDENLRSVRQGLQMLAMTGQLTREDYESKIIGPLASADYYMTKAWSTLVEGDREASLNYVNTGEEKFEKAIKALEALFNQKAEQPEAKGTSL